MKIIGAIILVILAALVGAGLVLYSFWKLIINR